MLPYQQTKRDSHLELNTCIKGGHVWRVLDLTVTVGLLQHPVGVVPHAVFERVDQVVSAVVRWCSCYTGQDHGGTVSPGVGREYGPVQTDLESLSKVTVVHLRHPSAFADPVAELKL